MVVETKPEAPVAEAERRPDLEQLRGGEPLPSLQADRHSEGDPAVETPVEARQGFLGRPVLMVLIGGLVLAMISWLAVEMSVY